jgi:hypothetical protein
VDRDSRQRLVGPHRPSKISTASKVGEFAGHLAGDRFIFDQDGSMSERDAVVNGVPQRTPILKWDRRQLIWLLIALSYFVGAIALYWHFPLISHNRIPLGPVGDQVQEVWFLAWPAHAISHLQNPFFTTALNNPAGVNMVTNTTMLGLGVLFAPITWIFGPLATYVFLLQLGFFATALSAAVCARRLGATWWGSWIAGAVFGFCAHRLIEGLVHPFMSFAALVPWIFYIAIRFAQGKVAPRRFAIILGTLMIGEFLISVERFSLDAIALGVIFLADVVVHRSTWLTRLKYLLWGYGPAAFGALIVLAVPLWYFAFGPQSISGVPHQRVAWWTVDFKTLFQPGAYAWFAPFGRSVTQLRVLEGPWDNANYIGVPLLLLALVGVWRSRRDNVGRGATGLALFFGLLSFGRTITIPLLHWHLASPYRLIAHIPVLKDGLPERYMDITVLAVAWLCAEALRPRTAQSHAASISRRITPFSLLVAAIALLSVVSLIPRDSVPAADTAATPWLSSAEAKQQLPMNSVVLSYPYPYVIFNTAMLDQADSGLWYQLIGGQAIVPRPNGTNRGVWPLSPPEVFDVFYRAASQDLNARVTNLPFRVRALPPLNAHTMSAFHVFVKRNHVDEIFFRQWGYHPEVALRYLTAAFGPGSSFDNGTIRIWHVGASSTP